MISAYHTKYFAHELTRRCPPDSVEKLAGALVDAQVDLNPHQVDAALFAFNSPLSKGALLAEADRASSGVWLHDLDLAQMREQYLQHPTSVEWTAAPPINHGDGIRAGQQLGAHEQVEGHQPQ